MEKLSMNRLIPALALCLTLVLGGCDVLDDLLTVDAPSRVVASDLSEPTAASLLVASVGNEFRCAFTYYAAASALTGMEWADASNNSVLNIWDQRVHDTSGYGSRYASSDCGRSEPAVYKPLSRTRWLADLTLTNLDGWDVADVPDKAEFTAEVAMYAGYTYLLFGEAMCSVAFDEGPEQTLAESFQLGIDRFDQSIAAGAAGDILNAARVGKARALLNLGQAAQAATVASAVPPGFAFLLEYSSADPDLFNALWSFNHDDDNVTIGETYRNVTFAGVPDPRVAVRDKGIAHPTTDIQIWTADKFPDADTPMELATWEEAQLIMAEADVEAGQLASAVTIINALHTNAGLPAFASTDAAEIMDQIIYERAAEFFLEGHHLQDIKRLNIPLFPATGTPIPFGGAYGNQMCFKLPATEFQNNPTIIG